MATGAEVQGVDALRASLESAATELAGLAPPEAGQLLLADAEAAAPRDTGVLAASHDLIVEAGHITVINTAAYAAAVNARDPWLDDTLTADQERVLDIYTDAVADVVDTVKGA